MERVPWLSVFAVVLTTGFLFWGFTRPEVRQLSVASSTDRGFSVTPWKREGDWWISHVGDGEFRGRLHIITNGDIVFFRMSRTCPSSGREEVLEWSAGSEYGHWRSCTGDDRVSNLPPVLEAAVRPLPRDVEQKLASRKKEKPRMYPRDSKELIRV